MRQETNETLHSFLTGEAPFTQAQFAQVPSCFATTYGWVWDTVITKDGIRDKIDTMVKNGIRAFYILPEPTEFRPATMVTRLSPPYLSPDFFALVRFAVSYAESLGMYCWMYDEGGWPSGSACGRVRADWHSPTQTAAFIESTHVPFAVALQGCRPGLMFTDEPCKRNGEKTGDDAADAFSAALTQIADFCHKQGWLLGGHLDKDNKSTNGRTHGYGSALQCLQAMDVPGVDAIGWQIASDATAASGWEGDMPFFPRMASSAAAQTGHALALTETFGAYGNAVSPNEMRWILGAQIVRGINVLNYLSMPYDLQDWFPCHERSFFAPEMPGFSHLHAVTEETERAAYFMAHGNPTTDTALLFPQTELWQDGEAAQAVLHAFCEIGSDLENQGIDFDIVDERTLARGTAANGVITIGLAKYRQIVVPQGATLKPKTQEIIANLFGDSLPVVRTNTPMLWHKCRRDGAGQLYVCLFNRDVKTQQSVITVDTNLPLYRMDPQTGRASPFVNGSTVTMQSGELLLLWATDAFVETAPCFIVTGVITAEKIGMQKKTQLVLDAGGARLQPCEEPLRPMADFASAYGPAFSGEVAYHYSFTVAQDGPVRLSVKDVADSAEVKLNGQIIGYFTTAPYSLIAEAVCGENTVTLTVANPAANAFVHTDMTQWFTPAQIGPYHEIQRGFERLHCRGGLHGPLTVSTLKQAGPDFSHDAHSRTTTDTDE